MCERNRCVCVCVALFLFIYFFLLDNETEIYEFSQKFGGKWKFSEEHKFGKIICMLKMVEKNKNKLKIENLLESIHACIHANMQQILNMFFLMVLAINNTRKKFVSKFKKKKKTLNIFNILMFSTCP